MVSNDKTKLGGMNDRENPGARGMPKGGASLTYRDGRGAPQKRTSSPKKWTEDGEHLIMRKKRHHKTSNTIDYMRIDDKIYQSRIAGHLIKKRKRYTLIDLFSGAGGMSLGFSKHFGHVFVPIWANDFNEDCVNTYNENFGSHCVLGDINLIFSSSQISIPKADVVIGGPPLYVVRRFRTRVLIS